jgi:predicted nuclease of predicted toxin-antitoxin system
MRFLADVGVSPSIVAHLRSIGHDVESLVESGRHRLTDREIYAIAAADRRTIVTFDLDFAALAAAARGDIASVLIFRLDNPRNAAVVARIDDALGGAIAALEQGAVVVFEPARLRVRRLPLIP